MSENKNTLKSLLEKTPEELNKSLSLENPIYRSLLEFQAKLNLALIRVEHQMLISEQDLNIKYTNTTLFTKNTIDDCFLTPLGQLRSSEDSVSILSVLHLLKTTQQTVSFLLQNSDIGEVKCNDLNIPYHPLEAEILDIIDGVVLPPEKYTPHHPLGGIAFFQKHYKKYIDANVIYQDYLANIDKNLLTILRKAFSKDKELLKLLPQKTVRIDKLRDFAKKHPELVKKARRVSHLR